ncbi:hypothetical protein [Streptomyces sp. CNQ085]|uniref:hypothetical protein n=1 Tax=Streptomyces sp. CNQ085 TaxID=2886944 RepID=UPI001F5099B5|nr:hypothetical protein [Streptomyces sp. CNQ085]MCI0384392.1 hypothetical protein [Streptomyces sp. CNQ085]
MRHPLVAVPALTACAVLERPDPRSQRSAGSWPGSTRTPWTVCAVTSLTAEQAPPARLAQLVRGHRHIEAPTT